MNTPDPRRIKQLSDIIDLLVKALGEPSCPIRRVLVLNDIWQHPGATLKDIIARLDMDKSTAFRDVDWLIDHGCVVKKIREDNKREINLFVFEKTKQVLDTIYHLCGGPDYLASIIKGFMNMTPGRKQSLREAKILVSLTLYGKLDKHSLSEMLYDGPTTTDQRALQNLINEGFVEQNG